MYAILTLCISSASCSNVREKLCVLKDAVEELCSGSSVTITTIHNTWTSVPMTTIGSTNLRHPNTFSFVIPNVISSTAKNVLIYATMLCGCKPAYSLHLKVFTKDGSSKRFDKYFFMLTWSQVANNTNVDNMWFPMSAKHRIYMTVDRDLGTNCGASLYKL